MKPLVHSGIGISDCPIAAMALPSGLELVTLNVMHFLHVVEIDAAVQTLGWDSACAVGQPLPTFTSSAIVVLPGNLLNGVLLL